MRYSSHMHMRLEGMLFNTPKDVEHFLETMNGFVHLAYEKDIETLTEFAQELGGPETLEPWDIYYYQTKYLERHASFNWGDILNYFTFEGFWEAYTEHQKQAFGLIYKKTEAIETPHPDCEAYYVHLEDNPEEVAAVVYLDYFKSDHKRLGGWAKYIKRSHLDKNGVRQIPHIHVLTNFPVKNTKPDERHKIFYVNFDTGFHEGGHLAHNACSNTQEFSKMAGSNIAYDLVEIPAKQQNRFVPLQKLLQPVLKNYQTGEPVPEATLDAFYNAGRHLNSMNIKYALEWTSIDFLVHKAAADGHIQTADDLERVEEEFFRNFYGDLPQQYPVRTANLRHIFISSYDCVLYNYHLADIITYARRAEHVEQGLYDEDLTQKMLDFMAAGDTRPPKELLQEFMGSKDIALVPYLKAQGLVPKDTPNDQHMFTL